MDRAVVDLRPPPPLPPQPSNQATVCFIQFLSSRSGKSSCMCAPRLSLRLAAQCMVTTAWAMRLSSSSVSTRSLFQIRLRSVTLDVGHLLVDGVDLGLRPRPASARCGTRRSRPASSAASPAGSRRSGCRPRRGGTCRAAPAPGRAASFGSACCGALGLSISPSRRPGGAAEHDQVDQAVGAEAVGAVDRDAGRLADREQAGHDAVRIAVLQRHDLAVIIGRDAAHVVMDGRRHRHRLAGQVDAGEDLRRSR